MKIYGGLILLVSALQSMQLSNLNLDKLAQEAETQEKQKIIQTLVGYLPNAKDKQLYYSSEEIVSLEKDKIAKTVLNSNYNFLKTIAAPIYLKTLNNAETILKRYCENQSKNSNQFTQFWIKDIELNDIDPNDVSVYQQSYNLREALFEDLKTWQDRSNQTPMFHPLLFLQHNKKDIFHIFFKLDSFASFDLKTGLITLIEKPPAAPSISKKQYDRYPHSIKKQKLVQDRR